MLHVSIELLHSSICGVFGPHVWQFFGSLVGVVHSLRMDVIMQSSFVDKKKSCEVDLSPKFWLKVVF